MKIDFSDHAKTVGECTHCGGPTNNYENCANDCCNELVLICLRCKQQPDLLYHTDSCRSAAKPRFIKRN
jgi:UPF0176 protein